ncbi:hypothetical protein BpHYR1_001941 [Brachionus plicatilis]|uniref:Uncharacterized protein n=1 Tax=Brachionus plicatilis TaxID=10195 RepID=A0A3M7QWG6_BRAPC|nr:hypothetical protein BpHYR1_001941 [Brachionus plicatilis]
MHTIKKYLIKKCNKLQSFCRAWNSVAQNLYNIEKQNASLGKWVEFWVLRPAENDKQISSHKTILNPSINQSCQPLCPGDGFISYLSNAKYIRPPSVKGLSSIHLHEFVSNDLYNPNQYPLASIMIIYLLKSDLTIRSNGSGVRNSRNAWFILNYLSSNSLKFKYFNKSRKS